MEPKALVTDLRATIPAETYIAQYRDPAKFLSLCRECRNFGRLWACPPFARDWAPRLARYSLATIFVTKIVPPDPHMPLADSERLFIAERRRIEPMLLRLERETNGLAFAFAGECLHCPKGECTRPLGLPCRHPDLVRPSLEAAGFDIGLTTEKLFSLPLKWSADGFCPEYFVLVCGLFHNLPLAD